MTTIVFVHGTGTRGASALSNIATVLDMAKVSLPDAVVWPCHWGDTLGAPPATGPALFVDAPPPQADATTPQERTATLRAVLDLDPLNQLRVLNVLHERNGRGPVLLPGEVSTVEHLRSLADVLGDGPDLRAELESCGLSAQLPAALAVLLRPPWMADLLNGMQVNGQGWSDIVRALAEALVAQLILDGADTVDPPDDGLRNRLVDLVFYGLKGGQLSVRGRTKETLAKAALIGGVWLAGQFRAPLDAWAHPFVGDILRFLAHGGRLRALIEQMVADAEPPVILLGHSLGGIACLDLLARRPLPAVSLLVTVGSQGSQLHRMGALPGLEPGEQLPSEFPPWLNVHSRHDLLSYLAEPVFGDRVRDVELVSAHGMPKAHSAYLADDRLYALLARPHR